MKKKHLLIVSFVCFLFLLFTAGTSYGQKLTVKGTVTDADDKSPMPGVNVTIKGTTMGTITNPDGSYSIEVPKGTETLVFSYVGYFTQEIPVSGRTSIDAELKVQTTGLSEIIVIGYGTQKKSDLTGSIAVVNANEIGRVATNDITKALQGKMAGISVQSGGEPGAVPNIKIRGVGSFNNNTPLYIVDGAVAPINDLPMSDIESIQVLKDASAAAIYGSRAANGVVIVTTKRGKSGAMKIDYSGYFGSQNITKTYNVLGAKDYQTLVNEASVNAGVPLMPANDPASPFYVSNVNTDWQKEVMKTGHITEHNLNLSGGSEASTFNASLNYFDQTPTVVGNGPAYKRYAFGLNSDHKLNKFKFGESIHYTYADQTFMTWLKDADEMIYMVTAIPTLPVYDSNTLDGYSSSNKTIDGSYTANVIGMNKLIESTTKRYRFIGNTYGEYEFIPGLKYRLNLSFERTDWRDFHFDPVHELGWAYVNNIAKMDDNRGFGQTGTLEQTLTFDKVIGKSKFTAMAGNTVLATDLYRTYGHAEGFSEPYFKQLSNGTTRLSTSDEYHSKLLSYFGRLIYSWDDRFLFTGTIRRDGSSRFSPSNRWGNFPSVAVAWKLHNEQFMKSLSFISQAKLRLSYGELGNQEIGDYLFQAYIDPYANYALNNSLAPGASQYVFNTPDIRWEAKKATNVGIDLAFLKNSITFTAEYYKNTASDMLVRVPVPGTYGSYPWESPLINGASVENKGFEFSAGYNNSSGDFKYSVSANLTTLKNKVLSLGYGNNPVYGTLSRTSVGSSVGEFYGFVIDGIFQTQPEIDTLNVHSPIARYQEVDTKPGDYKFRDINGRDSNGKLTGKPDGKIDDDDRAFLGNAIPTTYFGLSFYGAFKNFDFSITAGGSAGNKIFNAIRGSLEYGGGWDNYGKNLLDRWTPSHTNTDVPRVVMFDPNKNARASSRWLENGNYLKITSIELGYTLPAALTAKAKIASLRVYMSAQNVYTFTKYTGFDPDFGNDGMFNRGTDHGSYPNRVFTDYFGGLPNPRTILFGVKLGI